MPTPGTPSHGTPISDGTTTIAWNHTTVAGENKLNIMLGKGISGIDTPHQYTSCTFNAVACNRVANGTDTNFEGAEIWELNSPPIGTFQILATCDVTFVQRSGHAISWTNAAAADGAPAVNHGTGANPSVTVPDTANGDYVISICVSDEGSNFTLNENGTLIGEDENHAGGDSDTNCQRQVATGASTVCGWTAGSSGQGWAAVGIGIKDAGAGGGGGGVGLEESGYYVVEPQTNPTNVSTW